MTPQITMADRPDPATGREATAAYAEHRAAGHLHITDELEYRAGYVCLATVDAVMPIGYRLLDVGCGTAGHFQVLRHHGSVVGIDYSRVMIEEAERMVGRLGLERVTFECVMFEDYKGGPFDAVKLAGTIGWYVPWPGHESALVQASSLLRDGGLVVIAYVPPRSLFQWAKTVLFPRRTVVISRAKVERMVGRAGFRTLFATEMGPSVYLFAQKPPAKNSAPGWPPEQSDGTG